MKVFVNNRLGICREILCSPTDTISDFKKSAAMKIGIKPEAMVLKRQGQRQFRDHLTLKDYEIGNGSPVELEIDRGDD